MSWEKEPLFTKSQLFFEKAFEEEKSNPFFGLWCAMGLELLCRSAIAHISPTLLADPDPTHNNLLHALNLGSAKHKKKSLVTIQVLNLCQTLIPDFTEDDYKTASAIINQRNEELHTGSSAFGEYPTSRWIGGFYKCCKILSEFQGQSLSNLFDDEIEEEANILLEEEQKEVTGQTKNLIAAHSKVFSSKPKVDQELLSKEAEKVSIAFSYTGSHKVECPACKSVARVTGEPYGKANIETTDDAIVLRQSILPTSFQCTACELKLNGYSSLKVANLADHYTRRISYTPEEYFEFEPSRDDYDEYNNE